jgi:legumain
MNSTPVRACSDAHDLRAESLKQQYQVVKDRTSGKDTDSLRSHVMQYGDLKQNEQSLFLFMGTDPANDDDNATAATTSAGTGTVNQRDADLVYFWQK